MKSLDLSITCGITKLLYKETTLKHLVYRKGFKFVLVFQYATTSVKNLHIAFLVSQSILTYPKLPHPN